MAFGTDTALIRSMEIQNSLISNEFDSNFAIIETFVPDQKSRDWCISQSVRVTAPGEWDYPPQFLKLRYRPGVLFYIGKPLWLNQDLISIVGSRSPHATSLQWLEETLTTFLQKKDAVVVSGGARGIDQKAHQIALLNGRPTVAFLPSGLAQVYPREFSEWFPQIVSSGGCIVSQFLPFAPMANRYFRQRNYLIAALSKIVLAVECRRRSGTMLTARYALELDKVLAVMPTHPSSQGAGGLDLICDQGALPVRDALDLVLAIG